MATALIDIGEARSRVLASARPLEAEAVALESALDRVVAETVVSPHPVPPFDSSAMDGYARAAGGPAELPLAGEARAGRPSPEPLRADTAMLISTGAALPAGADAVVPLERARVTASGRVALPEARPGANVRRAGEDIAAGATVIGPGTALGPSELGVLASVGRAEVLCARRPRVAVCATGDELAEAATPLGAGQIHDSNGIALAALATRAGAEVVRREVLRDDPQASQRVLADLIAHCDVLCLSGGVSVGPHDHVKAALAALGVRERFWGVRLKPGKPTWFGEADGSLVFGLPGNPVSAIVTFVLFVRPALRLLQGADPAGSRTRAVADATLPRNAQRDQALRCRLTLQSDGWHVSPTKAQESHVLTSMLGAGALALVTAGDGAVAAGEAVEIELLDR